MTPYNIPLEKCLATAVPSVQTNDDLELVVATEVDWYAWRGTKRNFIPQVQFLQQQLKARDGDIHQLLKEYVTPSLLTGWIGALTHTIIHLGWAIDAGIGVGGSDYMILEGLAYMNFAHLGFEDNQLNFDVSSSSSSSSSSKNINNNSTAGDMTMMDSLVRVATVWHDDDLGTTWIDDAKSSFSKETFHPELVQAGFQWEVAKVVAKPHNVATDIPGWIHTMPLSELWQTMWKSVTLVFLATRTPGSNTSNFVVLHLLSSLWGLEKVLQVLDDEVTTRHALSHYYAGMIVFLSMGGFPTVQSLLDIQRQYPFDDYDENDTYDWPSIVDAGIAEVEEHNIKLVYVCQSLWNRYDGRWTGFREAARSFTITPTINVNAGFHED
jgi:hypothetical protein